MLATGVALAEIREGGTSRLPPVPGFTSLWFEGANNISCHIPRIQKDGLSTQWHAANPEFPCVSLLQKPGHRMCGMYVGPRIS